MRRRPRKYERQPLLPPQCPDLVFMPYQWDQKQKQNRSWDSISEREEHSFAYRPESAPPDFALCAPIRLLCRSNFPGQWSILHPDDVCVILITYENVQKGMGTIGNLDAPPLPNLRCEYRVDTLVFVKKDVFGYRAVTNAKLHCTLFKKKSEHPGAYVDVGSSTLHIFILM